MSRPSLFTLALLAFTAPAFTQLSNAIVAVPYQEVRQLRLVGDTIAGLFVSSTGESSLVTFEAATLRLMGRVQAVDAFDFQDGQLFYSQGERLIAADARALNEIAAYTFEHPIRSICVNGSSLWIAGTSATTGTLARLIWNSSSHRFGDPQRVAVPPAAVSSELVCSTDSAAMFGAGAAIHTYATDWQRQPLEAGYRVVALDSGFAYLAAPSRKLEILALNNPSGAGNRALDVELLTGAAVHARRAPGGIVVAARRTNGDEALTVRSDGSMQAIGALAWSSWMYLAVDTDARAAARAFHRDGRLWLEAATMPERSPSNVAAATGSEAASPRALTWLTGQLTPVFTARSGWSARLIDSYEDETAAGWTYDAALAVIAMSAWQRHDTARELLAGLHHLQNADGSWEFSYDPNTRIQVKTQRYIGSMAWVVMAANFYQWETSDRTFVPMVDAGLKYIDRFTDMDPSSPTFGGVSMGPVAPDRFSTEHNVDCYSAFFWAGRLNRNPEQQVRAQRIKEFVLGKLWATGVGTANGSGFLVGFRDPSFYLDAQTWTALSLGDREADHPRLLAAVNGARTRLTVERASLPDVEDITGMRETDDTSAGVYVWSEGSEGMVAALRVLGQSEQAERLHAQTLRYQAKSGGIPYATANRAGRSTRPSVAGTGWFLLNRAAPPRNPFHPDSFGSLRR